MKHTVKQRQTAFDIALIACGDREAAFEISRLNDISLSDTIEPGTELEIPAVRNKKVVDYYKVNGIEPATEDTDTADEDELLTISDAEILTITEEENINTIN
jgi:LysM repeat protein